MCISLHTDQGPIFQRVDNTTIHKIIHYPAGGYVLTKQATLSTDSDLQLGSEKVDATVSIYSVTTPTKAHKIFKNILCKLRKKLGFLQVSDTSNLYHPETMKATINM